MYSGRVLIQKEKKYFFLFFLLRVFSFYQRFRGNTTHQYNCYGTCGFFSFLFAQLNVSNPNGNLNWETMKTMMRKNKYILAGALHIHVEKYPKRNDKKLLKENSLSYTIGFVCLLDYCKNKHFFLFGIYFVQFRYVLYVCASITHNIQINIGK